MAENAFDDVRHQRRLRRVELRHRRAIGPSAVGAVDSGIDEIDRLALIVDEEALRRPAARIGPLPGAIKLRVHVRLRAFDSFRRAEIGIAGRVQVGRKIALDLVNDLAAVVDQVFARIEAGHDRVRAAFFVVQNAIMTQSCRASISPGTAGDSAASGRAADVTPASTFWNVVAGT